MAKLRLLFITKDFRNYTERNTAYLCEELDKLSNLMVWYNDGDIRQILRHIPNKPEFILINDMKETRSPRISGLSALKTSFGIIMHDIHYKISEREQYLKKNKVQYIFSIYRDAYKKRFRRHIDKMIWMPHWINTNIFKDYGLSRDIDWLMMGKLASYYPLRKKMFQALNNKPGFVYHPHPGYRQVNELGEKEFFVGERYAREIAKAKMFLTCDSIFHYPIIKYYEVLACKTLLLAPASQELSDLGFIPGVNFVEVDQNNFMEKADYYLANSKERESIAETGFHMVRKNHSVNVRATQLIESIKAILARSYA
ncbi:MAG: glycosyltransferase [Acidobacteriota bacterium]